MLGSPLEGVLSALGAGGGAGAGAGATHEKAAKQAVYNALALVAVSACGAAGYVLFLMLQPFLKPLMWALLLGSLLHPFKHRLARRLKCWFDTLERAGSSVPRGLLAAPLQLLLHAADTIGCQFKDHYKLVLGLLFIIFGLPWLYNSVPRALVCMFWQFTNFFSISMKVLINIFNSYIMLTVALAYLICIYTLWSPERAGLFRKTSLLMWLSVSSYLAGLAGTLQVYVFIVLQVVALAGFFVEVLDIHNQLREKDPEAPFYKAVNMAFSNTREESAQETKGSDSYTEKTKDTVDTPQEPSITDSPSVNRVDSRRGLYKTNTLSNIVVPYSTLQNIALRNLRKSLNESDIQNSFKDGNNENETALYFKLLFFGCTCVLIWKQIWLLPLLLFFLCIHVVKKVGTFFGVWMFIEGQYMKVANVVDAWWKERSGSVIPAHMRGIAKMVSVCNSGVRSAAYDSVDTVSSCIVITALILFFICASIFLCIQIYSEALIVVQLGGSILNSTVVRDSELWNYLPEGWEDSMDSLFDNAYTYGREGISKLVKNVLKDNDSDKISRVENQVLELWDRVYQSWMSGSFQSVGPKVDNSAIQDSWDNFLTDITKTSNLFNYSGLVEWLQANVGTLTAIAGSVWAPLASNVSLLAGSVAAFASVLLCGGTAILNFIFSLVVLFTTLFYLLASSGALYKPVELITQTQPSFGPRLGIALSVAINQVFRASFKMALFYGLWTWLVHNLFGAKIVYLPSALAAVLGAAPFLGTWLACVPATLDVWLAQGRPLAAILLPIAQAAPVSFVDAAIYKEIRNGGHPYLTGLAIAGGIFYLGPEGAILGPLLLCCLLVVLNLSSTFLRETPSQERAALDTRIRLGAML